MSDQLARAQRLVQYIIEHQGEGKSNAELEREFYAEERRIRQRALEVFVELFRGDDDD